VSPLSGEPFYCQRQTDIHPKKWWTFRKYARGGGRWLREGKGGGGERKGGGGEAGDTGGKGEAGRRVKRGGEK